jgi:glycosyltransferase involved in cell wall biosynthesis
MGAPQARVSELAEQFAAAGHDVHVLTGMPSYPSGIVPDAYRGQALMREMVGDANVVRTWTYATPNRAIVRRALAHVSFVASSALVGQWLAPRPDVVIATSPPIFAAVAGLAIAKARGARFVMEVRDLWPESIVAVGALSEASPIVKATGALADALYAQADGICVVTDSFVDRIAARGVLRDKIFVVKNGVDPSRFQPFDEAAVKRERRALGYGDDDVVCTYAGTIGMSHALGSVLELAATKPPRLKFLFVGDGAERAQLEARARGESLSNVRFLGEVARERMPAIHALSDVCMVLLRRADLFTTVIPSKLFEILAMERPIVLGVDGEARALLEVSGGGVFVPPEAPAALGAALARLAADPELRRRLGKAGRAYVLKNHDRSTLATKYLTQLEAIAARPKR